VLQKFDRALEYLRTKNVGCTPDGKTIGEVMPHFVWGGDETGFLASAGDVKIIGDKHKAKHELPTGTSRTSITLYRTGSVLLAPRDLRRFFLQGSIRKRAMTMHSS